METNIQLIENTKRLLLSRYPRFASELAGANIEFRTNLKYKTAATNGKDVYFDPDYLTSLNEDERVFIMAHELLHIKFGHAIRLEDKNGHKKDPDVWNEATDAIINANLERDGFKVKEGYINRPEALNYSAEEFYEILLKEKQNNKDKKENSGNIQDDHTLWEEAFENHKNSQSNSEFTQPTFIEVDERSEFKENREQRKAIATEQIKQMREEMLKKMSQNQASNQIKLGEVGESSYTLDWINLIRKEIEKNETIWSQRRSIAENNYAYRLEEIDLAEDAESEAMIDVSGSVDLDLVKAFLRILKPLLKHSKLRVGCFNRDFWGMVEIKSTYDIDNFSIPTEARGMSACTEDWDLAVRSFTKRKEINKFVFTDGIPGPGNMPKEDLKNENVVWIVYGNPDFRPCCGKVIVITEEQLKRLQSCQVNTESLGKSR